jgi:hypothetical protein
MVSLATRSGVRSFEGIDQLWEIPDLPEETAAVVEHARLLSLFAKGTTLQYYRMLIDKKDEEDAGAAEAFEAWWTKARDDLGRWNIEAFFALIQSWGADRRPLFDREFIKGWVTRCVAGRSGQKVLDDPETRRIIGVREDRVRPGKQRLRMAHYLQTWQQPSFSRHDDIYQLGYRHQVGRRFAQDIADGIGWGAA